MNNKNMSAAFVVGILLCIGLALRGFFIATGIVRLRALERTVTVKGLSEREVPANVAIWPIKFSETDNDLNKVFSTIQRKNSIIVEFLKTHGFQEEDISVSTPAILDRESQTYPSSDRAKFRYTGHCTITVYSKNATLFVPERNIAGGCLWKNCQQLMGS